MVTLSRRINLLPMELRPRLELPPEAITLGVCAFLLTAALTLGVSSHLVYRSQQRALASLQDDRRSVDSRIEALSVETSLREKAAARYSSIQEVVSHKTYWVEIFKELTALMPRGVWLSGLASSLAEKDRRLVLRGEAPSQEKVAEFFRALEASYYFNGVTMKASERQEDYDPSLYRFEFVIPIKDDNRGK